MEHPLLGQILKTIEGQELEMLALKLKWFLSYQMNPTDIVTAGLLYKNYDLSFHCLLHS